MSNYAQERIIVSDFDDTIRHTNAKSKTGLVWNLLFKRRKVFSGMPRLLNSMKDHADSKLSIVTGSPNFLRGKVKKTLAHSQINYDELITKSKKELKNKKLIPPGADRPSTYYYKIYKISKMLDENPGRNLILLGDDAGGDPDVFAEIKRQYPGRIDAVYVRAIKNTPLPKGMNKFVTAYDIAWQEVLAGRMDKSELPKILEDITSTKNFRTTIPNFAHCPTSGHIWNEGKFPEKPELLEYAGFIMKNCRERARKKSSEICEVSSK